MKDGFLSKHFDKIASAVIAGIVGFFSAIVAVKSDVAKVGERVIAIETWKNLKETDFETLKKNIEEMRTLKTKLETLELKDQTATLITRSLEERLKNLQIETLKQLAELLEDRQDSAASSK